MFQVTKRYKSALTGQVTLPTSKSISNRVLIINALTGGGIKINSLSKAKDTKILNRLLKKIKSNTSSKPLVLNCRDGGTTTRFLITYTALCCEGIYIITGSRRLQQRPLKALTDSLLDCGANISYQKKEGFLPVKIQAASSIKNEIFIDCSESSQFLSSLLLVAPYLKYGLIIKHNKLTASKPYIDMTIRLMKLFGVNVLKQKKSFIVYPQKYQESTISIEADWSAAAFWYQMVSLEYEAELLLKGLKKTKLQGDIAIVSLFKELGVSTTFTKEGVIIKKTSQTLPPVLTYDFSNTPDIFPSVLLSCVFLNIEGRYTGIRNLELKESRRISVLQEELSKFGVKTKYEDDIFFLYKGGIRKKTKAIINTADDHRIAMSFAAIAVKIEDIFLSEGASVSKSYPDFWAQLNNMCLYTKKL